MSYLETPKKTSQEEFIDGDWEALKKGGHFERAKETALREGRGLAVYIMKDINCHAETPQANCRFMYYGDGGEGWKRTLATNPSWARSHLSKYSPDHHLLICLLRSTPNGCFGVFHICDNNDFSIIV